MAKELMILSFAAIFCLISTANAEETSRDGKLLPIFQVVKFPNDACTVTGGSKNGTCYTAEECSTKGGTNAGSCASGFGVCCTFTLTCGGSSNENCTYFDTAATVTEGACRAQICKCNDNICQIRLDFNSFVITGPSTISTSVVEVLAGAIAKDTKGVDVAAATQCQTDTFSITNQNTVPLICGTNNGEHVYFDASESCNSLDFQLGNNPLGVAAAATRSWSIKVTQYSCDYENKAPPGCTQWHYGSSGTNYVQTFNFQTGTSKHLANQNQVMCVRREAGNCQICWSADAAIDVGVSGKVGAMGKVVGTKCCNYGTDGKKIATTGYDCVMIPGASDGNGVAKPPKICGTDAGLVTAAGATSKTVCSKAQPFRIIFKSDNWETFNAAANMAESAADRNPGFKVRYFQKAC